MLNKIYILVEVTCLNDLNRFSLSFLNTNTYYIFNHTFNSRIMFVFSLFDVSTFKIQSKSYLLAACTLTNS